MQEATRIAADACRGLAAAHAVGLVHRDMKPANLLRAENGTIKVADFGLAKPSLSDGHNLTQTGQIVGTPYFMSPEQCEARQLDHRSDIYSLGATYYTLLTGADPYQNAGSIVQVMYAHCTGDVLDPARPTRRCPRRARRSSLGPWPSGPKTATNGRRNAMATDLEALAASLTGQQSDAYLKLTSSARPAHHLGKVAKIAGTVGAVAAAIALVAVGAGVWRRGQREDGADGITGVAVPAATAVAAPSGPPIRVGMLHSLSGTMFESESPVVEATLLAIDELNAAGGVLGRPVEPLVRDGKSRSASIPGTSRETDRRGQGLHGVRLLDFGQSQDHRAPVRAERSICSYTRCNSRGSNSRPT